MAAAPAKVNLSARQIRAGALWLLVICALAYLLYLAATGTTAIPRKVTPDVATVRLEHVLPPPPPPPPPQEKFVEQPKIKTPEVKPLEAPQPQKPPAPAGPASTPGPPALAARGEGPSDAFGLGGNPNGGDYVGGGGGGGGGGSAYGWYAQLLEARIAELLRREGRLHGVRYHVLVQLWMSADGSVQRAEFISPTGKADVDRAIQDTLKGMARLPEPPPAGMPEPVRMDLSSR